MGFGTSMGYNFTNNMWSMPMMNNGFGFNNFNWGTPSWGTSAWTPASSSYSSTKKESAEEYEARIKKEIAQKNEQKKALLTQRQELQKGLTQIQEQQNALNGTVKEDGSVEVKGSIQADGTIKEEKLENMSTGAKILRGVGNFFQGIGNVCKSFVGIDSETGKWDPIKCVRNVAIGVGVGALCVFAAPLGAAAAAGLASMGAAAGAATAVGTAIAAVPTVLGTAGLATGVYMAGKGVRDTSRALDANSLEEFDKGTQDIGAGVFIGASSAAGLRSMSKAAGVASVSNGSKLSSITAGLKNTFVNPWKAASQNFEWASSGYELGGLSGAHQAVKSGRAGVAKTSFEANQQKLLNNLEQKIADVEARYNAATDPKTKALIELEYDGLVNQYSKMESGFPTTKTGWKTFDKIDKEFNSQLKGYKKATRPWAKGEVEIHGQKFTAADKKALSETISSIRKSQQSINQQMSALKAERFSSMRTMASVDLNKTQVEEFGFGTKWYSAPYNWLQSKYYGFTMPKGTVGKAMMLGNGAFYISEPVWALQGTARTPVMLPLKGMYAYNPTREKSEAATTVIPAEQYAQAKTGYDSQAQQIRDAIGQIDSQLDALT